MDEWEAPKQIRVTFGFVPGSKYEEMARKCLWNEVKSIEEYNKSWKQRNKTSQNIEEAMQQMITCFEESKNGEHDYGLKDILDFVMTRREAFVFSVLYAKIQSGYNLELIKL